MKKFRVFIPEPEWKESHKMFDKIAEVRIGKRHIVYSKNRLIKELENVDALIITSQHHITREIIEAADKLKVIAKYGSKPGPDNVDLTSATNNNIVVCYTPGANSDSVAEHTITLILALTKRLCLTSSQLRKGIWRNISLMGHELLGQTVGIIGLGTIGSKVAEKLRGLQVNLLTYDPYVSADYAEHVGARLVSLKNLLKESRIVTIHAGLNEETFHLIGEEELKLMRKNSFIINTARGAILNEKALAKALSEGWISGAALDVFEEEPPSHENPLLGMENVLVTPHFASCTREAFQKEAAMAAEEVIKVLQGLRPRFVANPEVLPKLNLK